MNEYMQFLIAAEIVNYINLIKTYQKALIDSNVNKIYSIFEDSNSVAKVPNLPDAPTCLIISDKSSQNILDYDE